MLHHERLRPPSHDYPADEWNVIEKRFHPEFLAQLETMLALGNGYLGMRGCPEEGGPNAENSTLINGFYETRPIVYDARIVGNSGTGIALARGATSESLCRHTRCPFEPEVRSARHRLHFAPPSARARDVP